MQDLLHVAQDVLLVIDGLSLFNKLFPEIKFSFIIYQAIESGGTIGITYAVVAGVLCPEAGVFWAAEVLIAHTVLHKK